MKHLFDKQNKYSIRKLSIGVCSAVIGMSILNAGTVYADGSEPSTPPLEPANTVQSGPSADDSQAAPAVDAAASASNTGSDPTAPQPTPDVLFSGATYTEADREATTSVEGAAVVTNTSKSDTTDAAVANITATTERPGFEADKALDGDATTAWIGDKVGGVKPTLTIELDDVARVDSVTYASMNNANIVLGTEYHNVAGLINKGYLEYSKTGEDGSWERVSLTNITPAHFYTKLNNNVEGGSGFERRANSDDVVIHFNPLEAKFIRLVPVEARTGPGLPDWGNAELFSASKFLANAKKLLIEERTTIPLTTDEIHWVYDDTRFVDEVDVLATAEAGSKTIVKLFETVNGQKSDQIGDATEVIVKPKKAVHSRGTQTRPDAYATLVADATTNKAQLELNSVVDSTDNKALIASKIQFQAGQTGRVVAVTPADTTASTGDKYVLATVKLSNQPITTTVDVVSTNGGWAGNDKANVLTDAKETYWASVWSTSNNLADQPLTLTFNEPTEIDKVRYQPQFDKGEHGKIVKGKIEYLKENGDWEVLDLVSVTPQPTKTSPIKINQTDNTFSVPTHNADGYHSLVTFEVAPVRTSKIRLVGLETFSPVAGVGNHMVAASTFYALGVRTETIAVPVTVVDSRTETQKYTAEGVTTKEYNVGDTPSASDLISNKPSLPTDARYTFKENTTPVTTAALTGGSTTVVVTYPVDNTFDEVTVAYTVVDNRTETQKYTAEGVTTKEYNVGDTPSASDLISNKPSLPTDARYTFKENTTPVTTAALTGGSTTVIVTYPLDNTTDEVTISYTVVDNRTETQKYTAEGVTTKQYNLNDTPNAKDLIANSAALPSDAVYTFKENTTPVTTAALTGGSTTVVVTYPVDNTFDEVTVAYTVVDNRTETQKYTAEGVTTKEYNVGDTPSASDLISNKTSLPTDARYTFKENTTPVTTAALTGGSTTVVVTYPVDNTFDEVTVSYTVVDNRPAHERYTPQGVPSISYDLNTAPSAEVLINNRAQLPDTTVYSFKPGTEPVTTAAKTGATTTVLVTYAGDPVPDEVVIPYTVVDTRQNLDRDPRVESETTEVIPVAGTGTVANTAVTATNSRPDFPASNAFDTDRGTAWVGDKVGNDKPTLTIELAEPALVDKVTYGALQNGNTLFGAPHHPETGVITEGYIEYKEDDAAEWKRAKITNVGNTPADFNHPYNNALDNVEGGSGFQRRGNRTDLDIHFEPIAAKYIRLVPTKALVGNGLPENENATVFSASTFKANTVEIAKFVERKTEVLKADDTPVYNPDNNLFVDQTEEVSAAVDGSRVTETTYESVDGVRGNAVGTPIVTTINPTNAVFRRGTKVRPATLATFVAGENTIEVTLAPEAQEGDIVLIPTVPGVTATIPAGTTERKVTLTVPTPNLAENRQVIVVNKQGTNELSTHITLTRIDATAKYNPTAIATPTYTQGDAVPAAADLIANRADLPTTAAYAFKRDEELTTATPTPGTDTRTAIVVVTYGDTTSEEVPVTYTVRANTTTTPIPAVPARTSLKPDATTDKAELILNSDVNSAENKAKILDKLQLPTGAVATVTAVSPATATANLGDTTVTATVTYDPAVLPVTVATIDVTSTNDSWAPNNKQNVLTDEKGNSYWASAWGAGRNTDANREYLTLTLSEPATIEYIKYQQRDTTIAAHGRIKKGYIEYRLNDTDAWQKVDLETITGGAGTANSIDADNNFNVTESLANNAVLTLKAAAPFKARQIRLAGLETEGGAAPNTMIAAATFYPVSPTVKETIDVPVTVINSTVTPPPATRPSAPTSVTLVNGNFDADAERESGLLVGLPADAQEGHTVKVYAPSGQVVGQHQITAQDKTESTAAVVLPNLLENNQTYKVTITNAAGQESDREAATASVTGDTVAPVTPTRATFAAGSRQVTVTLPAGVRAGEEVVLFTPEAVTPVEELGSVVATADATTVTVPSKNDLVAGTTYRVVVRDAAGNFSGVVAAQQLAAERVNPTVAPLTVVRGSAAITEEVIKSKVTGLPENTTLVVDPARIPSTATARPRVEVPVAVTYSDGSSEIAIVPVTITPNSADTTNPTAAPLTVAREVGTLNADVIKAKVTVPAGVTGHTLTVDPAAIPSIATATTVNVPVTVRYADQSTDIVNVPVTVANNQADTTNPTATALTVDKGAPAITADAIKAQITGIPSGATVTVGTIPPTSAATTGPVNVPVTIRYTDSSTDTVNVPVTIRETAAPTREADRHNPTATALTVDKGAPAITADDIKGQITGIPAGATVTVGAIPSTGVVTPAPVDVVVTVKYSDNSTDTVRVPVTVRATAVTPPTTPGAYPPAEAPDPAYTRPTSGLGAITNFTFNNGRGEIVYETGERAQLNFYNDHVFRFHVDKNGNFPDNPALVHADRPVNITVKSQADYQAQYGQVGRLVEEDSRFIVETDKVLVIFDKATSRMSVYDRLKGEFVTKEVEPIQITNTKTTQTLSQGEKEYFFGGGMQNGRFTHKGNKIRIVNENNWVDNGVASPAPFYWSSNGYGVMRHTFMPGEYNFGTEDKTRISNDHSEARYDAFFFVNDKPEDIIKDYHELTGKPAVLPLYALYLGHLNAYNRDYWREVPEGTRGAVRQGDGKWYREFDGRNHTPEAGDVKETLNGENGSYEFSARRVIERYKNADMPLSWFLPNDGYGAGYGQGANIDENIANLKAFVEYAKTQGIDVGLWTQADLVSSNGAPVLHRDIDKEVGEAGIRAIKTDVAWVGPGYNFGLNGVDAGAERITTLSGADKARPFIVSLDGWAGTHRSAAIWSGDQSGGEWEYIRFHIPTYIGLGLSGNPNVGSDMDGIFGGGNAIINARDYQWKTFTSILMNMDGWGKEPKMPFAFGDNHPTTDLNRIALKLKSTLVPYAYSTGHQATETGKPIVRAMFMDFPGDAINYTKAVQYQYMYGDNLLVAPVYENTNMQANGDDIRNNIYLPAGSDWIDFYTGKKYEGGQVLNGFEAPIWKIPVFVRDGAIIPMTAAHNTAGEMDRSNRLFTFYPKGDTSFKHYEDDGKSVEYKEGKIATTLVESKADANGRVELKLNKTEGEFDGMIKNKTTELHVNVSKDVTGVEATVNGQRVTLTRVNTLEEYNNGTNVFFYHNDPVMETYNPRSAEIQGVNVTKNDLLKVKLAASDITAGDTIVTINGFENKNAEVTPPPGLQKPATPTNLAAPDSFVTATSMKVTWDASERADSYDVEHNGVLYRNITGTEFTFKDLEPGSEHTYKVRAVNAAGNSDWSDAITKQTSDDPWLNAIDIDPANVRTNITAQGGQGIEKLVNKQKGDQFHSAWNGTVPANPYIRVDLGGVYDLSHLEYHQRGDGGVNGRVTWARFYVSEDGENWTETGAEDWRGDGNIKRHNLDIKGRYVHMAIEGHHGQWVSGEELLVFKKPGTNMLIPGDINNDSRINEDDKTSFFNYAGLREEDSDFPYIRHVDRNKNGLIDALDISVVATQLDGGVTTPSTVAPSGNLRFEAEKLAATAAGEEIKVYLVADDLAAVNALTSTFKFNADDFEVVGNRIVPEAFVKDAENFSQVRPRGSQGDVVFNFINFGDKELMSGSGRVAYLTLKAKRPAVLDFTSADGILVGNDLRHVPVENQPVTALVNYTAAPAVPTNLAATRPTHGSVTLTWDAVPEASRYIIEKEVDGQFVEVGRTSTPSFNVYNLAPDTGYNLRVRASNPLGESANSEVLAASTVAKNVAGNITPADKTASTPDQPGEGLDRFFDGDEGTIYHSQWGKSDAVPSTLTLDLGDKKALDRLVYVPRPAATNGTITGLTVETSLDGTTWTPTGETIRWDRNALDKIALFPLGTEARYIRINWNSSVGGFVSGQELYVIEGKAPERRERLGDPEVIDFNTLPEPVVYVDDSNLPQGEEREIEAGQNGSRTPVYEDLYVDGQLVQSGLRPVKYVDEVPAKPRKVRRGTKVVATGVETTRERPVAVVIPFGTDTIEDATLPVGTEEVVTPGVNGSGFDIYIDTYLDGALSKEATAPSRRDVTVKPVNQVVRRGTKPVATNTPTYTYRHEDITVPYQTETIADPTLAEGVRQVERAGSAGAIVKVYRDTIVNGVKIGTEEVSSTLAKAPVNEVVRVGTKKPVTDTGKPVDPTKPTDPIKPIDTTLPTGKEERRLREVLKPYGSAATLVQIFEDIYVDGKLVKKGTEPIASYISKDSAAQVSLTQKPAPQTPATGAAAHQGQETPAVASQATPAKASATSSSSAATLPQTGEAENILAILGAVGLASAVGLAGARKRED